MNAVVATAGVDPHNRSCISVCICTYRRPAMLAQLLRDLERLQLPQAITHLEIIVADNDPAHSAQAVLGNWRGPSHLKLIALHVPEANISLARNAAVGAATGAWIAMIDDDETPPPNWLVQLMDTQRRFLADAVFAPVIPRYATGTPDWIIAGRYFERRRFPSGTVIDARDARTGNVLIAARWLNTLPGPFDPAFGRTGGEDSLLFRALLRAGARLVWCDEAGVTEEVPLSRATGGWLLMRSYRTGQTWVRAELHHRHGAGRAVQAAYVLLRASIQLATSLLLSTFYLAWSRLRAFTWLRKAASQAGKLTALSPFQYQEYGKSNGT